MGHLRRLARRQGNLADERLRAEFWAWVRQEELSPREGIGDRGVLDRKTNWRWFRRESKYPWSYFVTETLYALFPTDDVGDEYNSSSYLEYSSKERAYEALFIAWKKSKEQK